MSGFEGITNALFENEGRVLTLGWTPETDKKTGRITCPEGTLTNRNYHSLEFSANTAYATLNSLSRKLHNRAVRKSDLPKPRTEPQGMLEQWVYKRFTLLATANAGLIETAIAYASYHQDNSINPSSITPVTMVQRPTFIEGYRYIRDHPIAPKIIQALFNGHFRTERVRKKRTTYIRRTPGMFETEQDQLRSLENVATGTLRVLCAGLDPKLSITKEPPKPHVPSQSSLEPTTQPC